MRIASAWVCIGFALFSAACNRSAPAPSSQQSRDPDARPKELAVLYGANFDWLQRSRLIAGGGDRILTADLQREWMNGKPIVFPGVLIDAIRQDPVDYLLFIQTNDYLFGSLDLHIVLQLECSAFQVDRLLKSRKGLSRTYAVRPTLFVVARITHVSSRWSAEYERSFVEG